MKSFASCYEILMDSRLTWPVNFCFPAEASRFLTFRCGRIWSRSLFDFSSIARLFSAAEFRRAPFSSLLPIFC